MAKGLPWGFWIIKDKKIAAVIWKAHLRYECRTWEVKIADAISKQILQFFAGQSVTHELNLMLMTWQKQINEVEIHFFSFFANKNRNKDLKNYLKILFLCNTLCSSSNYR